MRVGIPTEIKNNENRVAITPAGVHELVRRGHEVFIQAGASIGSGFSDDQRKEIWTHRKDAMGMIAEVKADAVTQNQDGTYSLRFPRFLRFRGFKAGEKL